MATKTIIEWVDDVDGTPADETVRFTVDGDAYEIDVNSQHADEIRKALAPYIASARRVKRGRGRA